MREKQDSIHLFLFYFSLDSFILPQLTAFFITKGVAVAYNWAGLKFFAKKLISLRQQTKSWNIDDCDIFEEYSLLLYFKYTPTCICGKVALFCFCSSWSPLNLSTFASSHSSLNQKGMASSKCTEASEKRC